MWLEQHSSEQKKTAVGKSERTVTSCINLELAASFKGVCILQEESYMFQVFKRLDLALSINYTDGGRIHALRYTW